MTYGRFNEDEQYTNGEIVLTVIALSDGGRTATLKLGDGREEKHNWQALMQLGKWRLVS
jgi:hypothetical protein